jgi:hypothetical protein
LLVCATGRQAGSRGGWALISAAFSQISLPVYNLRMHNISSRIADVLVAVEAILAGSGKRDALYSMEGSLLSAEPSVLIPLALSSRYNEYFCHE